MRKNISGYTVIELMTVTAVISILSAFAMTAYSNYVKDGEISVVSVHFEDATRFIRNEYANATAEVAIGVASPPPVPNDANSWITMISKDSQAAPGGGPTYLPGLGDSSTGAIGIQVTGTYAAGDSTVTVTQPAFNGMAARTVVIEMDA